MKWFPVLILSHYLQIKFSFNICICEKLFLHVRSVSCNTKFVNDFFKFTGKKVVLKCSKIVTLIVFYVNFINIMYKCIKFCVYKYFYFHFLKTALLLETVSFKDQCGNVVPLNCFMQNKIINNYYS